MSRRHSMATDWQECRVAYDDAIFFTGVSKGWADASTQGWRDDLAEKAKAFKDKHGIEFDPFIPVVAMETEADEFRDLSSFTMHERA